MKQKNTKKTYKTVLFLGKELFSNDVGSLLETINKKVIGTKKTIKIFTPNPEQLVLAQENKKFSNLLDKADILIPDGVGVVLFSKLKSMLSGKPGIKERITGVDLVQKLLKKASDESWKTLLIGGRGYSDKFHHIYLPGISREKKLSLLWSNGYENVSKPLKKEEESLEKLIKKEKPKMVFVAFGAPWQEKWVIEHEELLNKSGVELAMVVGGSFDMLLGGLKRAPMWIRAIGMEWLFRLAQEPRRFKRQLKIFKFVGLATKDLIVKN